VLHDMTRGRRLTCAVLVLCAAAVAAQARTRELVPVWGVAYGTPQGPSAALGLALGQTDSDQLLRLGSLRGLIVQAEPGLAGGTLAVGFTDTYLSHLGAQFFGWGLRAAVLRTWGSPREVPAGRTYAGVQLDGSLYVKVRVGVLWRVGHEADAERTLLAASVGFGF
jgi:hypothetical protein